MGTAVAKRMGAAAPGGQPVGIASEQIKGEKLGRNKKDEQLKNGVKKG